MKKRINIILAVILCFLAVSFVHAEEGEYQFGTKSKVSISLDSTWVADGVFSAILNIDGDDADNMLQIPLSFSNTNIPDDAEIIKTTLKFNPMNYGINYRHPHDEDVLSVNAPISAPVSFAFYNDFDGDRVDQLSLSNHDSGEKGWATRDTLSISLLAMDIQWRRASFKLLSETQYLSPMRNNWTDGENISNEVVTVNGVSMAGGGSFEFYLKEDGTKVYPEKYTPVLTTNEVLFDSISFDQTDVVPVGLRVALRGVVVRVNYLDNDGYERVWEDYAPQNWNIYFDFADSTT